MVLLGAILCSGVLGMPYGSILLATMVAGLLGPVTDPPAANSIRLDGEKVSVYWNDGDSLRVRSGRHKGTRVRLMGYNTLESFGPVHSWGEWTGDDLWALQDEGTRFARSRVWTCKSGGERDHYKRREVSPKLFIFHINNL